MKFIIKIFLFIVVTFGFFTLNVNAGFFDELLGDSSPKVHIDCGEQDCNIESGVVLVRDEVNGIEKDRKFSEYIQDVVIYLLTFISIIAVIYIIYAGFRIMTGVGNEETLKKQKMTILYVVLGILVIWLAYPITKFIMGVIGANV